MSLEQFSQSQVRWDVIGFDSERFPVPELSTAPVRQLHVCLTYQQTATTTWQTNGQTNGRARPM